MLATLLSWLALAAAPAADAAATAAPPSAPAEKPKLICTRERRMGSNMPVKVCRTPGQVEAEARATQRILDMNAQQSNH